VACKACSALRTASSCFKRLLWSAGASVEGRVHAPNRKLHLCSLLHASAQSGMLGDSQATLQELRNVRVLHEWRPAVPPLPLSRFSGLRVLTLCCVCNDDRDHRALLDINRGDGSALDMLSHLPVSLEVMLAMRCDHAQQPYRVLLMACAHT